MDNKAKSVVMRVPADMADGIKELIKLRATGLVDIDISITLVKGVNKKLTFKAEK